MRRRPPLLRQRAIDFNSLASASGRPLTSEQVDDCTEDLFIFKLGLKNSFGVDFRTLKRTSPDPDSEDSGPFHYLSEALPFLEPRAARLTRNGQRAYQSLADRANDSFWNLYASFQPLVTTMSSTHKVDGDQLSNALGRCLLLYDKSLGFKLVSYVKKSLHESIKNLRGKEIAREYGIPLTAGRVMPQLMWRLSQAMVQSPERLSSAACESLVLEFLETHPVHFSPATMTRVASIALEIQRNAGVDPAIQFATPPEARPYWNSVNHEQSWEYQEEHDVLLNRIYDSMVEANFSRRDRALVLQHLNLPHESNVLASLESSMTSGAVRNKRSQLMVRFLIYFHAPESPRFGRFRLATPIASQPILRTALQTLARDYGLPMDALMTRLFNAMALSHHAYRLSISERGQLQNYLDGSKPISGHLHNKLKAALIDQDRQGCPCLRAD